MAWMLHIHKMSAKKMKEEKMKEKAKKILFQKMPIAVIAVVLSFALFNLLSTPAMVELIKLRTIVCVC